MTTLVRDQEFQRLVSDLQQELSRQRRVPVSTYRLQLNADFTFEQAQALVPYFHRLGITDCYASPIFKSRPGSTHGYDITDPQALNPEIGTPTAFDAWCQVLQQHGMGLLIDIVPNHMGVIGAENLWWRDVLKHGPASPFALFFDIDWEAPQALLQHKVLLPILGGPYGDVLKNQELCLVYHDGGFEIHYFDHHLPVHITTVLDILEASEHGLRHQLGIEHPDTAELQRLMKAISDITPCVQGQSERFAARYAEASTCERELAALYDASAAFRSALEMAIKAVNGTKGDPRSFDRLHALLEAQAYRLSFWRVASDEINYRRFFDIVDLAGVRVEDPIVFEATHDLILRLLVEGKATGVRIDHPDGLLDPAAYFERLQQAYVLRVCQRLLASQSVGQDAAALAAQYLETYAGQSRCPEARPLYVVIEKILEGHETLPETWPVDGTSGYDFLNQLNNLFVDSRNAEAFADLYFEFTGQKAPFADTLYDTKKLILETSLSSELARLGRQLVRLAETQREWRDYTYNALTEALAEIIACFPVYRTYVGQLDQQVSERDRLVIDAAVAEARRHYPTAREDLFDMLSDVLALRYPERSEEADRQLQRDFVIKFQQITGPVMAKGLEDTTFYRYTPLLSLNDVGGDPCRFGESVETFHQHNIARLQQWSASLLATSTHDTKRSEDIRARLNVLSEIPDTWQTYLTRWHAMNQEYRSCVEGRLVPSLQDEYFLYQTLLGVWPFEACEGEVMDECRQRIQEYMRKALREAKVHTTWTDTNSAYEAAIDRFVEHLLDTAQSQAFLADFQSFQQVLAEYGMWNALAQTLLKITVPGVPDFYQGCDLWDLSLVDPDNRRAVDYAHREALLAWLQQRVEEPGADRLALVRELVENRRSGCIKLYTIWQGLTFRRACPDIFLAGTYEPLEIIGSKRDHLCAFARVHAAGTIVVIVPRLLTRLLPDGHQVPVGPAVWEDTRVVLPEALGRLHFKHRLTAQTVYPESAQEQYTLSVASVLEAMPVTLLTYLTS